MSANWLLWALVAVGLAGLAFARLTRKAVVYSGTVGLLYRDGVYRNTLEPGFHRWLDLGNRTLLRTVPVGPVALQGFEFTVITKDQFSFRVTLTPVVRIVDARRYFEERGEEERAFPLAALHFPRLHSALAAQVLKQYAERTLEEFLATPVDGIERLEAAIAEAAPGAEVDKLLLTAVTMPPEIRKMFTEVERTRREGLAALERARGETATLRALANAARALSGNPQLAHLRTLQAMESAKGAKTFVLGADLPAHGARAGSAPANSE